MLGIIVLFINYKLLSPLNLLPNTQMSDKTRVSNFAFEPEIITMNDSEFPDFEILIPEHPYNIEDDEFADLPDLIPFDDLNEQITTNTNDDVALDTLQLNNLSELISTQNEYNLVCYVLELLSNKITTSLDKYKEPVINNN